MSCIKLTQRIVDSLPQTEKLTLFFDQGLKGFGVYTTKNAKTYFIQARVNNKKEVKRTIGKASLIKLDAARTEAKELLALIAKGINPVEMEKKNEIYAMTLSQAFEKYCETRSLKPGTVATYKKFLKLYLADWLTKPVSEITKDEVAERHKRISADHGEVAANNTLITFRAIYNFVRGLSDGDLPDNPVKRLSQTRQWNKVRRRTNYIKPHELSVWYAAVAQIENQFIRDYLLLTLFTGLRKMEGLTLKWSSVNMRGRSFTVLETKNGLPHTMPMSTFLYNLFLGLQQLRCNEYVFWGAGAAGHLVEPHKQLVFVEKKTKLLLNSVTTADELTVKAAQNPDDIVEGIKFCLHDLRRTFITVAESLDIPYAALKRLLNHSEGNDVTGGYLQITTDRLREPMERISTKLLELMQLPTAPEPRREAT